MKAMTPLRRLGALGRSDGFNLLRNRHRLLPPLLKSTARSFSTGSPASEHRRWQILSRAIMPKCSTVTVAADNDDKAVAESRTSSGRPIRASIRAAAPPAISHIHVDEPGGGDHKLADSHPWVIAAHGDSVLLRRRKVPQPQYRPGGYLPAHDYFVYKAAAGQPPSLSLLPACSFPMIQHDYQGYVFDTPQERSFDQDDTGILRRGGTGELLVAQLRVATDPPFDTAELCLLRPGRREWELKTGVPIVQGDGGGEGHDLGMWQEPHVAVPVGDRFLCWANFDCSTFLVCDMAEEEEEEGAKIRYVPLPVKAVPPKDDEDYEDCYDGQPSWLDYRSIGAVAGARAVRFVSIDNRCCCGAPLAWGVCEHSTSAFVVSMWSLELKTAGEPMAWVKEGVLDCEELWSLAASNGLPRVWLTCPVVSSENPDIVCFVASNKEDDADSETVDADSETVESLWTLEIDVRRKKLVSVLPCPAHPDRLRYCNHLRAELQIC